MRTLDLRRAPAVVTVSPTCPVCRGLVCSVSDVSKMPHSVVVIPAVQSEHHIGLTIRSSDDGVASACERRRPRPSCRIGVGSLITHLNGIRVTDQHRAVDIIQLARDRLCPLHNEAPTRPWRRSPAGGGRATWSTMRSLSATRGRDGGGGGA